MKTFATYALMATTLAVRLSMLEKEKPETDRIMDKTHEDFNDDELMCIG